MQIELSKIKKSPNPVRTVQDTGGAEQLVHSIKEQGLLQAVKLRPVGDMFEVVFGNRRVEACRRAGFTHIEAVVEPLDDKDTLIQALMENVQREDVGPMDLARGLKALKDKTGWSLREMAKHLGMSYPYISQLMSLLQESEEVQELLTKPIEGVCRANTTKPLTERHVRAVRSVQLPKEDHIKILQEAAKKGQTAGEAEKAARDLKEGRKVDESPFEEFNALDAPGSLVSKIKAREEKAFWSAHEGGMADEYRRALSRADRILEACWGRVKKFPQSLPAEHIPYIESRTRKLGEKLIRRADALNAKRIKEVNNDQ